MGFSLGEPELYPAALTLLPSPHWAHKHGYSLSLLLFFHPFNPLVLGGKGCSLLTRGIEFLGASLIL